MYDAIIKMHAEDILTSDHFLSTKEHIQHGNVTVYEHCISVAKTSLKLQQKLRMRCSEEDLVRGALLHDYFLYDWHVGDYRKPHKLHGFYHPGRALKNARRDYVLTEKQENIISRHMWPLTIIPPSCKEAWIVTTADKYCSLMETFGVHKGAMKQPG